MSKLLHKKNYLEKQTLSKIQKTKTKNRLINILTLHFIEILLVLHLSTFGQKMKEKSGEVI